MQFCHASFSLQGCLEEGWAGGLGTPGPGCPGRLRQAAPLKSTQRGLVQAGAPGIHGSLRLCGGAARGQGSPAAPPGSEAAAAIWLFSLG